MFIVNYKRKDNGESLGYHLDTFGSLGKKEHAKCYGDDTDTQEDIDSQLAVIRKNLNHRLSEGGGGGMFAEIFIKQKEQSYQGLNADQIDIVAEAVVYKEQELVAHTIVDENGVHKIRKPLVDVVVDMVKKVAGYGKD
jgi:hypothetical protein